MSDVFQTGNYNYNLEIEESNASGRNNIRKTIAATSVGLLSILPNQVFTTQMDHNVYVVHSTNVLKNSSNFLIDTFDEGSEIWNLPKKGDENSMANEYISDREFESSKETINQRFINLEDRLARIEETLNKMDSKMDNLVTKENLSNQTVTIKTDVQNMFWTWLWRIVGGFGGLYALFQWIIPFFANLFS